MEPRERFRHFFDKHQYQEGEAGANSFLEEVAVAHGQRSVEAARILDVVVEFRWRAGKRGDDTAALATEALQIKGECLGPSHPELGTTLHLLGHLARDKSTVEARNFYDRAVQLFSAAGESYEPDLAMVLNSLSTILVPLNEYDAALACIERSVEIRERRLPPIHPDLATSLHNLGFLLPLFGEYTRAIESLERALTIREQALGAQNLSVAETSSQLGVVRKQYGDYVGARRCYERALAIRETQLGPTNLSVATVLNNLGLLLIDMGSLPQARAALERALAIREEKDTHGQALAANLRRVAKLDRLEGDFSAAQVLLDRALRIVEERRPRDVENAHVLDELASLATAKRDLPAAVAYYESSLAVRERVLGPDRPLVAVSAAGLGRTCLEIGDPLRASDLLHRAARIQEQSFGPDNIDLARTLHDLSLARAGIGDSMTAFDLALRTENIAREHAIRTLRWLGDGQALGLLRSRTTGLGILFSLLERSTSSPEWKVAAWDALVRTRAVHLDEMAKRHSAIVNSADPETRTLAERLRENRERLAHLTLRLADDTDGPELRSFQEAAKNNAELEKALAERSAEFRDTRDYERSGLKEVQAALQPGQVLLAFVRHAYRVDSTTPYI